MARGAACIIRLPPGGNLLFAKCSLQQLRNRLRAIGGGYGAAAVVKELRGRVDAQNVIDGGVEVRHGDRSILRSGAETVGAPDDATALDAAAAHHTKHGIAPVIASGIGVAVDVAIY